MRVILVLLSISTISFAFDSKFLYGCSSNECAFKLIVPKVASQYINENELINTVQSITLNLARLTNITGSGGSATTCAPSTVQPTTPGGGSSAGTTGTAGSEGTSATGAAGTDAPTTIPSGTDAPTTPGQSTVAPDATTTVDPSGFDEVLSECGGGDVTVPPTSSSNLQNFTDTFNANYTVVKNQVDQVDLATSTALQNSTDLVNRGNILNQTATDLYNAINCFAGGVTYSEQCYKYVTPTTVSTTVGLSTPSGTGSPATGATGTAGPAGTTAEPVSPVTGGTTAAGDATSGTGGTTAGAAGTTVAADTTAAGPVTSEATTTGEKGDQ